MRRNPLLAVLRLALAIPIGYTMPLSHTLWGQLSPGDGQQAFGFILIFGLIGVIGALVFFFIGSIMQMLLRKHAPRYTVFSDLFLFTLFTGVLVYAGVTAQYSDNAT